MAYASTYLLEAPAGTSIRAMDSRTKILDAAQRVYAEHGFRGATTRRIAETAGVNEVTLFRIFGSKESLLEQAVRPNAARREINALTDEPVDPEAELTAWVSAQLEFLRGRRSLIQRTMSESEERPQLLECIREGPQCAHRELTRYLTALVKRRWIDVKTDIDTGIAMLMGAIFSDAMGRELMPENFPRPVATAGRAYARFFLRAAGLRPRHAAKAAATAAAAPNGRRTTKKPGIATR